MSLIKPVIFAVAAASVMSLGLAAASAQSASSSDMTAGNSPASATPQPHKRHVERHVHRRYTTGVDLHSGSHVTPLPGKDELNSKAYIVDH